MGLALPVVSTIAMVFSVLFPTKLWFAAGQPVTVDVKTNAPVVLMLTDFTGKAIEPASADAAKVAQSGQVDVRKIFPKLEDTAGTYVLYAVPEGQPIGKFVGTPLVLELRTDRRAGASPDPLVLRVQPLQYATIQTDQGPIKAIFYYDVAPNTVENFLTLSSEGYYDGLKFHRVVPGFVIQGGDPKGDGSGGPGYTIPQEFNARPHLPGVLSMARQGDPNERSGAMPRPQFADSAGSQFFVCLDYDSTKALDNRYTAFGEVVSGMEAVNKIAELPLADRSMGRPANPAVIQTVKVTSVTANDNPYGKLLQTEAAAPATQPAAAQ